jgi:protein-S-isoprenylcysteine O-methyltransferase Ste14
MTSTTEAGKRDVAGVIAPPPLVYLGFLLAALGLDWLIGGPALPFPDSLRLVLATMLLTLGGALLIAAGARFTAANTAMPPWKPTTAIVTTGIYRYTRNPMYLGMALIYAGLSLFADSVIALAGLPMALMVMRYGVIAREERYLEGKFGAEYREYKSAVRRWL